MRNKAVLSYICIAISFLVTFSACRPNNNQAEDSTSAIRDSILNSPDIAPITDSIKMFPDKAALYYERSGGLFQLQHYDLAKADMQKAISLQPASPELYYALGQIDAALNNADSAENDFRHALDYDQKNTDARLSLANLYYHQKNYKRALNQLDSLKQLAPRLAEADGLSSLIYQDMGDTVKAISEMKAAVAKAPDNYEAVMGLGDLLSSKHNPEALDWYQKAFKLDTTRAEALYSEALYYLLDNDTAKAIGMFRKSIETDGNFLGSYMRLGELYRKEKDWKKGLSTYLLATKIAPSNADAYYYLGLCEEKIGKTDKAISYYRQASALNSDKAEDALKRLKRK